MSKKRMSFPMEVQSGSVIVKIYRVRNKAYLARTKDGKDRLSFMVSYFADGKRRQKMLANFEKAHAEAKEKAANLSAGQLDAIDLDNAECSACTHAVEALKPTGMPLELAAKEYAEAWRALSIASRMLRPCFRQVAM